MYLYPLVLLIPLGFAAAGLMGVWPVAMTGETRPPGGAGRGGAVTANERVGQG
jgi:hypothetical protein